MGGTSKSNQTTSQTQQTTPYGPATGQINSLIGQLGNIDPGLTSTETGALDALSANAQAGNPFAGQINSLAGNLLGGGGPDRTGMVTDALSQYQSSLAPVAGGASLDPSSNPQLQSYLSTIQDDVSKRVNGMFAGAGRDLSGANLGALGRGIAAGTAPVLYGAYNDALGRQDSARDKMFGAATAGAGLLSGLDQTKLGNQQAGVGVSNAAMNANDSSLMQTLAIEAQRRGIPLQNITSLLGPLGQIGQAFGTTTGNSNTQGQQQMSGAQQFAMIAQGLGSLFGGGQDAAKKAVSMGYGG